MACRERRWVRRRGGRESRRGEMGGGEEREEVGSEGRRGERVNITTLVIALAVLSQI
jgi:hypothetical protein